MNRSVLLIFVILSILPISFASDECFRGKNCTIWSQITQDGNLIDVVYANITIRDSNGTVIVNNTEMDKETIGTFKYFFFPSRNTSLGNALFSVVFYNGTEIGKAQDSIIIKDTVEDEVEKSMLPLAIIFGIISLVVFIIYTGKDIIKKSDTLQIDRYGTNKTKLFGYLLYILSGLLVSFIPFLLMIFSEGEAYYEVIRTIFIIIFVPIGVLSFFIMLVISVMLIYYTFLPYFEQNRRRIK